MSYNKMFLKRINKELEYFYNKDYYNSNFNENVIQFYNKLNFDVFFSNIVNSDKEKCNLLIQKDNTLYLQLEVPNCYPFKPIMVRNFFHYNPINKDPFHRFLGNFGNIVGKLDKNILEFFFIIYYNIKPTFLELKKGDCFCCASVTCYNNWCPKLRINNLLLEYMEIEFIMKYAEKNMYNELCDTYNKLFKKLPDDVVEIIMTNILKN